VPIYEYRCSTCGQISSALRKVFESKAPIACESCGEISERIVSRPSVHLSKMSKVEKLDPKYDKMVDRAMKNTASADPDRILEKMKPLSDKR